MIGPRLVFSAVTALGGVALGYLLATRGAAPFRHRRHAVVGAALLAALALAVGSPPFLLAGLGLSLVALTLAATSLERVAGAGLAAFSLLLLLHASPSFLAGSDVHYHVRTDAVNLDDEGIYTPGSLDLFDAFAVALSDATGLSPPALVAASSAVALGAVALAAALNPAVVVLGPLTLYVFVNFVHFSLAILSIALLASTPGRRFHPGVVLLALLFAALAHPLAGLMVVFVLWTNGVAKRRYGALVLLAATLLLVTWEFGRDEGLLKTAILHGLALVAKVLNPSGGGAGISQSTWGDWPFEAWLALGVLAGPAILLGGWVAAVRARRARLDGGVFLTSVGIAGSGLGLGLLLPQRWLGAGPPAITAPLGLRVGPVLAVLLALLAAFSPFVNIGFAPELPGAGADLVPSGEEIAANRFAAQAGFDEVWWSLSNVDARRHFRTTEHADLVEMPGILAESQRGVAAVAVFPSPDVREYREARDDDVGARIGLTGEEESSAAREALRNVDCVYSSGRAMVCSSR